MGGGERRSHALGRQNPGALCGRLCPFPIDLIPDFIPVLGYLDDLLIVPLGILAVVKLVPPTLIAEFRTHAATIAEKPQSRAGLAAVIAVWLGLTALLAAWLWTFI